MSVQHVEARFARVVRVTFDQIYDGVNTGRYRWDQLRKTEKTHFGSLIEINLQREFEFEDGAGLDFSIGGTDVDCKYSQTSGGWMIPVEAQGQLCLLVTADDASASWSAGLVRCELNLLGAPNRDRKRSLNAEGRRAIVWLWRDSPSPPNVLLQMDPRDVESILVDLRGPRLGQQRVNELFRRAQGRRITRGVVATVAQQADYMKRVRGNGGARSVLAKEGIVIFGDFARHQLLASQLGVPVPQDGEFVSCHLVRTTAALGVRIGDDHWKVAEFGAAANPAPSLPSVRRSTSDS